MTAHRDQLRQAPLFAVLNDPQLDRVLQRSASVRLATRQLLFHQDEPPARFYFVRDGRMRLFRLGPDGSEKVIELRLLPDLGRQALPLLPPSQGFRTRPTWSHRPGCAMMARIELARARR